MSATNNKSYEELRAELENMINLKRSENGIMNVGGTHFKRERDICKRLKNCLKKL